MSKMAKAAVGLMIVTLLSKVLGFGREIVLASSYGASSYSDAYLTALNIPNVIFASIGSALATTFIPIFFDVENERGKESAVKFTSNVINIVIILCSVIAVVGLVFTEPLVKIFAIGFEGEILKITTDFTRVLILGVIFIGLNNIITAYLQIKGNFIVPGLISLPYNIIVIVSIILSTKLGPYTMVYGTLIAIISQFVFQLPWAIKNKFKYKPYINIKDENIKKLMWLLTPIFIGIAVNQINVVVDRSLASTLNVGSISALNYSNKLVAFITTLFIASISSVIYPSLSKLSSKSDNTEFNNIIVKSVNVIVLVIIPISVGAIVLSRPIVELLFQRGEFDINATVMTSNALKFYSIGMIAFGLNDIVSKIFFSLKDTKTTMLVSFITVTINIVLNFILIKSLGYKGLALATSISSLIGVFILFICLRKKIGDFGEKRVILGFAKSIIAAIAMAIVVTFIYKILNNSMNSGTIYQIIKIGLSVASGAVTYLIAVILLKVEEVNMIFGMIKSKLKRG